MEQLELMVRDFSQNMDKEMIRKVCGSTRDRLRMLEMATLRARRESLRMTFQNRTSYIVVIK